MIEMLLPRSWCSVPSLEVSCWWVMRLWSGISSSLTHRRLSCGHELSEKFQSLSIWFSSCFFLALTPLCFSSTSSKRILGLKTLTAFEPRYRCLGQKRYALLWVPADTAQAQINALQTAAGLGGENSHFSKFSMTHIRFRFLCLRRCPMWQSWRSHAKSIWPTSLNASSPYCALWRVRRRPTCKTCRRLFSCCSRSMDTTTWWAELAGTESTHVK